MFTNANPRIKLSFFRGIDFSNPIGATDWRIGLYLREYGYDTFIYGRGDGGKLEQDGVIIFQPKIANIPLIETLEMSLQYTSKALKDKIDVVICNPGSFVAGLLYKILRPHSKAILDIRSIPVETQGLASRYHNRYFDSAFDRKFYDGVTVITGEMLQELDKKYNITSCYPTTVWGSGYDDELFNPDAITSIPDSLKQINSNFMIMFHGSISPTRGLDEAIKSIRCLKDKGMDDVSLVIIGDGAARSNLLKLTTELDLESNLIFIPPLPHERIPEFLAAADIGIDLLPNHPWWRNQSSLKVFEYLAMGKPVLATDIPCHENISRAVILVPNNEPETIAEYIARFRHMNAEDKEALREAALHDSKQYTWRSKAEILAKFIEENVLNQ